MDHRDAPPREPGFLVSDFMRAVTKVAHDLGINATRAALIVATMGAITFL